MGAVGPITTGPSEKAVSRSSRKRSVGDSGPEMIAISQVPWTSASAARSWRSAMSRTSWPATSSRPGRAGADDHRRRSGGVPVQRRRPGQQFGAGVTADHRIDDAGLHSAVPGAAGLGGVGVGAGRGEGQIAAVAQDAHRQRRHLLGVAGHHRDDLFEVLHRHPHHVDRLSQGDPAGEVLRHQFEGLRGVADLAGRVADPFGEVDDRGLHHQLHAGALGGLQPAKNGNRFSIACTASVASRPERPFSRRSVDSGISSSSSRGERPLLQSGCRAPLKATPYFGGNRQSLCCRVSHHAGKVRVDACVVGRSAIDQATPESDVCSGAASTSSIRYSLAAAMATEGSISPSRASASSTATTTDSASVLK